MIVLVFSGAKLKKPVIRSFLVTGIRFLPEIGKPGYKIIRAHIFTTKYPTNSYQEQGTGIHFECTTTIITNPTTMVNILQQRNIEPTRPMIRLSPQQQIALLPRPNNTTTTTTIPTNSVPIINGGNIINTNDNEINETLQNAMGDAEAVVHLAAQPNQTNDVRYATNANMRLVKDIINRSLFSSVKFLTSKADLHYDNNEHSISRIILTKLSLPADIDSQTRCWSQIQHIVPETLNRKRTSTTFAIKKRFKGTLIWSYSVH